MANASTVNATIANGQTASGAVDLKKKVPVGIFMPAAFTGTTITFTAATSLAGTYKQIVLTAGTALTKTVAASKYVPLDPADFYGVRFLKVVSGSAEGAERILELAVADR